MSSTGPDKTPGSDANRASRLLDNLSGDYIYAEGTPVVLADVLQANALALLAINETLERVARAGEAVAEILETKTIYVANANAV